MSFFFFPNTIAAVMGQLSRRQLIPIFQFTANGTLVHFASEAVCQFLPQYSYYLTPTLTTVITNRILKEFTERYCLSPLLNVEIAVLFVCNFL